MKITNASARLYYIAGQKLAPGQTAEVDEKWKNNKSVQASITKGELKVASKGETVTATQIQKNEVAENAKSGKGKGGKGKAPAEQEQQEAGSDEVNAEVQQQEDKVDE